MTTEPREYPTLLAAVERARASARDMEQLAGEIEADHGSVVSLLTVD